MAKETKEKAKVYIKRTEAISKMKEAEESFRPVFISAHAGWGKTALIDYYFRNRSILRLSCESGALNEMPEIDKIRPGVVVVDDVSWIDDGDSELYIRKLIEDGSRFVVLAGRGRFPGWLESVAFDLDFVRIDHQDLRFSRDDIFDLFQQYETPLNVDEANLMVERTRGYPPALKLCLRHHLNGEPINRGNLSKIKTELFHYYEETFFNRIAEDARQLLLEVCELPKFSSDMADALMDNKNTRATLDYCVKVGSFLIGIGRDEYMIMDDVREFIRWKRSLLWSADERIDNNRKIAVQFEKEGKLKEAADFYENVGATEKIWELLVRNSHMHPGVAQFHALRRHYESLPEEIIIRDPALIAGTSLLKSMTMRPDESEKWYRELEQFEKNMNNSAESRKEARVFLSYLDIGLPHRAGKGMIPNMKSAVNLLKEKDIELPEFSVTDNIPSVLDGGLDYSNWAKNSEQIMKFMGPILEMVLGRHGKGLITIGRAEAGFERGTMDPFEVNRLLNTGIAEATGAGSYEICFAGYGVMIYQDLVQGNVRAARECIESFREQVEQAGETQLIPNIEAVEALVALYESDQYKILRWLAETPDVHREFSIMDRYIHEIKVQCLVAVDSLPEAMNVVSYMDWYYREYNRIFSKIGNDIMAAIIAYRQGRSDWQDTLTDALREAEEYHYIQVAAMKGSALLPLLTELKTDQVSPKYLEEVKAACRQVALRYPDFMKAETREVIQFTPREQEILGLLCSGKSMEDICDICGISYSGLKKHNRNIYAKLGAGNRAEAERIAASKGLINRTTT